MTDTPEFSRPVEIDKIGKDGLKEDIAAEPGELAALAERMNLPAIHELKAHLELAPWKKGRIRVRGHFTAIIDQECVRTLDIFSSEIREPVERIYIKPEFVTAGEMKESGDFDAEAPDAPDIIVDEVIDIGELVAEALALALDPWPKKPGTTFVDYHAGEEGGENGKGDGKASPFAALEKLRKGN